MKQMKEATNRIMDILLELPPDVSAATAMYMKMMLPGPASMGELVRMTMGGPLASPMFRTFDMRGPKEREIMKVDVPFPFNGRFG